MLRTRQGLRKGVERLQPSLPAGLQACRKVLVRPSAEGAQGQPANAWGILFSLLFCLPFFPFLFFFFLSFFFSCYNVQNVQFQQKIMKHIGTKKVRPIHRNIRNLWYLSLRKIGKDILGKGTCLQHARNRRKP